MLSLTTHLFIQGTTLFIGRFNFREPTQDENFFTSKVYLLDKVAAPRIYLWSSIFGALYIPAVSKQIPHTYYNSPFLSTNSPVECRDWQETKGHSWYNHKYTVGTN